MNGRTVVEAWTREDMYADGLVLLKHELRLLADRIDAAIAAALGERDAEVAELREQRDAAARLNAGDWAAAWDAMKADRDSKRSLRSRLLEDRQRFLDRAAARLVVIEAYHAHHAAYHEWCNIDYLRRTWA